MKHETSPLKFGFKNGHALPKWQLVYNTAYMTAYMTKFTPSVTCSYILSPCGYESKNKNEHLREILDHY